MHHLTLGSGSVPDPLSCGCVDTGSVVIVNLLLPKKNFLWPQANPSDEQTDEPHILWWLLYFVLLQLWTESLPSIVHYFLLYPWLQFSMLYTCYIFQALSKKTSCKVLIVPQYVSHSVKLRYFKRPFGNN